jgi:hypothetical protein
VSWQWYVLIGSLTTFAVGWLVSRVIHDEAPASSALRS